MSEIRYTVITPNFNSGQKLAPTAATVLSQSANLEYLISDGASSDESIGIARRLAQENPDRVRLLSEKDRGIYDAMNKGIANARGRYIYFLGAGDSLLPGVLQKISTLLPSHDRGFIYGNADMGGRVYDGPFTWVKLCRRNICHQAIFYGRDVFSIAGNFNLKYRNFADWDFNLRCFGQPRIEKKYVPITIAQYEAGGSSIVGDAEFRRDELKLIRLHLGRRRALQFRIARLGSAWLRGIWR